MPSPRPVAATPPASPSARSTASTRPRRSGRSAARRCCTSTRRPASTAAPAPTPARSTRSSRWTACSAAQQEYAEINAAYSTQGKAEARTRSPEPDGTARTSTPGASRPSRASCRRTSRRSRSRSSAPDRPGCTPCEDLLLHTSAEVTLIDRLPVAGGLVRYGVAPDHPATKKVGETFARFHTHPRVRMHLGLEVGADITAAGAGRAPRRRDLRRGRLRRPPPGHAGRGPARQHLRDHFVAWYNAHPDVGAGRDRPLRRARGRRRQRQRRPRRRPDPGRRPRTTLAGTDIADHALAALRASKVREVVLLGRRGPEDAAYTRSELLALKHLPGVELIVDDHDPRSGAAIDEAGPEGQGRGAARRDARRPDLAEPPAAGRRIVLRFHSAPWRLAGGRAARRCAAVRVTEGSGERTIRTGLRAAGDRLPRGAGRRTALRRGHRHRPARGRPGHRPAGHVRRGLDQAGPLAAASAPTAPAPPRRSPPCSPTPSPARCPRPPGAEGVPPARPAPQPQGRRRPWPGRDQPGRADPGPPRRPAAGQARHGRELVATAKGGRWGVLR